MGAARQNLGSSSHLQKVFSARISLLAELHGVLFSHHASPLEVYVFVAVDERGEHAMSDEICRRFNGKPQRRGVAAEVCSSQTRL